MSFKETGNDTTAGFIWLRVESGLESFEPSMISRFHKKLEISYLFERILTFQKLLFHVSCMTV